MNDAEAAQQLQTIRTLMERAALYRRALGPVLTMAGLLGLGGAALGWSLPVLTREGFLRLWFVIAGVAIAGSFILVRKQALRAQEPFWTPPTRRVVAAMLPPATAGIAVSIALIGLHPEGRILALALPPAWLVCYGLALHAAGFFTLRGVRQLGWAFVLAGCALAGAALTPGYDPSLSHAHLLMGSTFGLGHLIAGGRLLLEERKPAA